MTKSAGFREAIDLGACTVRLLDGGRLKLDGGAMFGIIPKALWMRLMPADEQNRIQLACNCLLVEWAGSDRRAIIETGHGPKYGEKEQKIFAIDPSHWLKPTLEAAEVDPASITDVVVTHLHFDHAGGLTYEVDGRLRLTFPKARVHVQRQEHRDAREGFGIMTATYREESFAPLDEAGAWHLVDGEVEVIPGVVVMPTPGHTRGHQSVCVRGRERVLVFAGDLLPTRHHVGGPYNMGYDLFPIENRASKDALLGYVADGDGLLVIDHEPESPINRVERDGDWYRLVSAAL